MEVKIGVDGGGSKTECLLIGSDGRELARQLTGGSNPSLLGGDKARAVVEEAIVRLLGEAPGATVTATLLCMAGSDAFWRETGAAWMDRGWVVAVDDSLPVLELATDGQPGLVLHAGTGSFVAARKTSGSASDPTKPFGEVFYAGGLGWRFGDPGSGYELGRRAVARALMELQGWKEPSGLGKLVQKATGLEDVKAITRHLYAERALEPQIVALAPDILKLASEGDSAARDVAIASALGLLETANDVAARLFPGRDAKTIRAGLSGKLLNHTVVSEALAQHSRFQFSPVTEAPIEGVRRLLRSL